VKLHGFTNVHDDLFGLKQDASGWWTQSLCRPLTFDMPVHFGDLLVTSTSTYSSDPSPTNIALTLPESSGVRVSIRS
jgi:hypothetical protein